MKIQNMGPKIISVTVMIVLLFCMIQIDGKKETEPSGEKISLFAMDTYMEMTAYGEDAQNALEEAVAEIRRLDDLLSTGKEDSEISRLNSEKSGYLSEDTRILFERSVMINQSTQGAFDITIYPVMKAWGFPNGQFCVPDGKELDQLLVKVNTGNLQYDRFSHQLWLPDGVEIDFGGIAKGYTSMRVMEIFRKYQITGAVISLGGNVQTLHTKEDGSKWRIVIQSPKDSIPYLGILQVSDCAVITSGGYERFFEQNGRRYHHIIDPKTGYPANHGLESVTIVSADGILADGLSTALFVMGRERAVEYYREHGDQFEMVLYDEKQGLLISEGLEKDFSSDLSYQVIRKDVQNGE